MGDPSALKLYSEDRDRWYLRRPNPYSGCFLMTRKMLQDYREGPQWNYSLNRRNSPWSIRESAASGLLWDPRFGSQSALSHLRMSVVHQMPMHGVFAKGSKAPPSSFHNVSEYKRRLDSCWEQSPGKFSNEWCR